MAVALWPRTRAAYRGYRLAFIRMRIIYDLFCDHYVRCEWSVTLIAQREMSLVSTCTNNSFTVRLFVEADDLEDFFLQFRRLMLGISNSQRINCA